MSTAFIFKTYLAQAAESGIERLMSFTKVNTEQLEGTNYQIKVMKWMAYSYRDREYF